MYMYSPLKRWGLAALASLICVAASAQLPTRSDSTRNPLAGGGPGGPGRPATGPRPYKEIITDKAKTDDGLFKVHRVDEKYYFEIPDAMLERDILIVSRLSKAPAGVGSYAGDPINQKIIRFDKGPKDKIFLKLIKTIS